MAYHIEEKKSIRIIGIRIPLVEDAIHSHNGKSR